MDAFEADEIARAVVDWGTGLETPEDVVNDFFDLPEGAQLGVLRTVIPRALGALGVEQREGFLRVLRDEIDRAALGEDCYDLRDQSWGGQRHLARREQSLRSFLGAVAHKLPEAAAPLSLLEPVRSVLGLLGLRITEDEFVNLLAQLPSQLRDSLQDDRLALAKPRQLDAASFIERLAEGSCAGDQAAARRLASAVCQTLTERLGNAAIKARRQLPIDYLQLFQPGA